jgi:hypothetical protein
MYVTTNLSPDFFSGGENFQLTYMLIPYLLCLQIRKCSFSQKKGGVHPKKKEALTTLLSEVAFIIKNRNLLLPAVRKTQLRQP